MGYISKAHGHRGDFQLILQTNLPNDFKAPEFAFVEISEKLVPFFISKFEFIVEGKVIMAFEDINSLDKAEKLSSHRIFFKKEDLPAFENEDQFRNYELIGFTVIDESMGFVGIIEDVEENTSQPMLIVRNKKGEEVLIPLVSAFIKKVSKKNKQLKMSLPEGLLE